MKIATTHSMRILSATVQGDGDGMSIDEGACGYGVQNVDDRFPQKYIVAPVQSNNIDMYSGTCGECWEVRCKEAHDEWVS